MYTPSRGILLNALRGSQKLLEKDQIVRERKFERATGFMGNGRPPEKTPQGGPREGTSALDEVGRDGRET
jgi:hypothetical protein